MLCQQVEENQSKIFKSEIFYFLFFNYYYFNSTEFREWRLAELDVQNTSHCHNSVAEHHPAAFAIDGLLYVCLFVLLFGVTWARLSRAELDRGRGLQTASQGAWRCLPSQAKK